MNQFTQINFFKKINWIHYKCITKNVFLDLSIESSNTLDSSKPTKPKSYF